MADFTADGNAGSLAQVDAKPKLSINLTFVSFALGIPRDSSPPNLLALATSSGSSTQKACLSLCCGLSEELSKVHRAQSSCSWPWHALYLLLRGPKPSTSGGSS